MFDAAQSYGKDTKNILQRYPLNEIRRKSCLLRIRTSFIYSFIM